MCHAATVISGLSVIHVCVCTTAGLPDEDGRVAILKIHTKLMRAHGKLANDVDLTHWAQKAKNFSGAELEGLVRAAQATAMNKLAKVGVVPVCT